MSMEHRWGMRETIERNVAIDCHQGKPVLGRTRDISLSGIFVAAPVAGFRINSLVGIAFALMENNVTTICRAHAMVVRITDSGVGLMFAGPGETAAFLAGIRPGKDFIGDQRTSRRHAAIEEFQEDAAVSSSSLPAGK